MIEGVSLSTAWPLFAIALVGGYLLGSIPFGLVLTRMAGLGDIRSIGSGNIGATNVLRTGRKGLAAATVLLDGGKGAVAVLAFWLLFGVAASLFAGFGALLGHLFPVWLRFKGGKGMATTLGVLLAVKLPLGIIACLTWLAAAFLFRISSLAALLSVAVATLCAWIFAYALPDWRWSTLPVAILLSLIAVLVFAKHHENIDRLLKGTEPKIGQGKKP
ncbi:MAG: glycerol-3-phosphate 1-O-acyltransferase PlsY [Reyranellaceae bacterium]